MAASPSAPLNFTIAATQTTLPDPSVGVPAGLVGGNFGSGSSIAINFKQAALTLVTGVADTTAGGLITNSYGPLPAPTHISYGTVRNGQMTVSYQ